MANLTRYKQKIFANNSNQVGVFGTGTNKVASKNVETLQSADYEDGWSAAIITDKNYPIWQERDGVDYGFSYQLAYLMQKGIPDWLSTETYYQNDYCKVGNVIYYSLQDNNIGQNPSTTSGYWSIFASSSRNIGEVITSAIPLTDADVHLLDGTLISGSGSYSAFVTYISGIVSTYPSLFISEADWQAAVLANGVCDKFVYDSVNGTVRLPKWGNQIWSGGGNAPVKGNGKSLGLTNGSTNYGLISEGYGSYGDAFSGSTTAYNVNTSTPFSGNEDISDNQIFGVTTDGTKSGIITDLANITTAMDCYYYIVVATTTKNTIEVDIDEIATDLNGKADVDLSNCTKPHITDTYVNGTSWYRVYSDGWCEQGGSATEYTTINLLKTYANTNYTIIALPPFEDSSGIAYSNKTTSSFQLKYGSSTGNTGLLWMTCGYIA